MRGRIQSLYFDVSPRLSLGEAILERVVAGKAQTSSKFRVWECVVPSPEGGEKCEGEAEPANVEEAQVRPLFCGI